VAAKTVSIMSLGNILYINYDYAVDRSSPDGGGEAMKMSPSLCTLEMLPVAARSHRYASERVVLMLVRDERLVFATRRVNGRGPAFRRLRNWKCRPISGMSLPTGSQAMRDWGRANCIGREAYRKGAV